MIQKTKTAEAHSGHVFLLAVSRRASGHNTRLNEELFAICRASGQNTRLNDCLVFVFAYVLPKGRFVFL